MKRPQEPLGAVEVLLVVGLTLLLILSLGAIAVTRFGAAGVLLTELGLVFVPTATWLWARAVPLPSLGLQELARGEKLRLPPIVGALVAGAGTFYVLAAVVEPALERVYPTPPALREALERMVAGDRPLVVDLCALALMPAVAEELLFRGALYDVAERRAGAVAAVVVSALAFAVYHGSPHRFAPALAGGLVIGAARARARSLLPAIVLHATNNAGVLVALRLGYRDPPFAWWLVAIALGLVASGFALVRCRP